VEPVESLTFQRAEPTIEGSGSPCATAPMQFPLNG
jgi:hypothetical protein